MINERAFIKGKYCFCESPELIENYDKAMADTTQTWECHHRMQAVYTREELIKYGLYYNREPHQLIFLTQAEHNSLHKKGNKIWLGRKHSEESKKKMSVTRKGKKLSEEAIQKTAAANRGKKRSEETRKKMSEASKGMSNQAYGKHWYNNGIKNIFTFECPDGFVRGRLRWQTIHQQ